MTGRDWDKEIYHGAAPLVVEIDREFEALGVMPLTSNEKSAIAFHCNKALDAVKSIKDAVERFEKRAGESSPAEVLLWFSWGVGTSGGIGSLSETFTAHSTALEALVSSIKSTRYALYAEREKSESLA